MCRGMAPRQKKMCRGMAPWDLRIAYILFRMESLLSKQRHINHGQGREGSFDRILKNVVSPTYNTQNTYILRALTL